MGKVKVTCPNCGKDFEVDENATRGKCPYCKISLIFENVEEKFKPSSLPAEEPKRRRREVLEEKVNVSYIENLVDMLPMKSEPEPKEISDVAVMELIEKETDEADSSDIEKKVDKILKNRG
ncbi:MAG: hypothetical protein DRN17_03175 [Thermoplasmata archaeon]|nr:MAG: hypothetical protein DRN17_03175 [Thermoplasmata archaeon]